MHFSDLKILKELKKGNLTIKPFNIEQLNPNSYDFRLGDSITIFSQDAIGVNTILRHNLDENQDFLDLPLTKEEVFIDCNQPNKGFTFKFLDEIILKAGHLALMTTKEIIGTNLHHVSLCAKSSTGRRGIQICGDAGWGDTGFCTHWTLEVKCTYDTYLYKDMKIGQAVFSKTDGKVVAPYQGRYAEGNIAQTAKAEKFKDTTIYAKHI